MTHNLVLLLMSAAMIIASTLPIQAQPTTNSALTQVGVVESGMFAGITLESDVERVLHKSAKPNPQPLPTSFEKAISEAKQGDTISSDGWDLESPPIIPFQQTVGGPPFLFADDPEYIRQPEGAVLREQVNPGPTRLYLYHCNGTTGTLRRITAVIRNTSDKPMKFRLTRRAFPGVSLDYGKLGRFGIRDFFAQEGMPTAWRTIAPGATEAIDPEIENSTVKFEHLLHAWLEFETDQPGEVTVLQTDPDTPGPVASARIKDLIPPKGRSGAGRGKFKYSEYDMKLGQSEVIDTADGPRQLFMADGKYDTWMTGFHSMSTTEPAILRGNYGIIYRIKMRRTSSDNRSLALLIYNCRTVKGCQGMSGCVQVSSGEFTAGPVIVPSDTAVLMGNGKAVLLQVFPPLEPGKTEDIEIVYTPPGASCLPTPMLLVPFSQGCSQ